MKRFLSILCASALALLCLPGAVLAQNEARWDFDESAEGWNVNKANNGVSIEAKSGKLIYTLATYTKTARSGSIGDIVSAEQIGIGTDVVIQTRYGIVKHIIVYK